jgi:hypothetical protein
VQGHRQIPQTQDSLPRGQPLTCRRQQQRELGIGMRGPHVLDPLDPLDPLDLPAPARNDLNRDRP